MRGKNKKQKKQKVWNSWEIFLALCNK
jgi:hypothetical protein